MTDTGPRGELIRGAYCKHKECTDPVDGSPMPCAIARREGTFCGLPGRFWKMREEKLPIEKSVLLPFMKEESNKT